MTQEVTPPYLREEMRKMHERIQDLERNLQYTTQVPTQTGFTTPAFVAPVTQVSGTAPTMTAPPVVPPAVTDEVITIHMDGLVNDLELSSNYSPAVNSHLRNISITLATAGSSPNFFTVLWNGFGLTAFVMEPGLLIYSFSVDAVYQPGIDLLSLRCDAADGVAANLVGSFRFAQL